MLTAPDDVIERQVTNISCTGTVDNSSYLALFQFDDVSEEYLQITMGEMTSQSRDIDPCKSRLVLTYKLTLDMTFNSTRLRCLTGNNQSEERTVKVIPGKTFSFNKRFSKHTIWHNMSNYKSVVDSRFNIMI